MPTYQTNGIVIGRTNFGEADRIVRFITPEHGKLSAVAKGVRRIKSRLAGHLEPFAETQLTLATGRNLDIVASARLNWYPHDLTADYERLRLAYVFAGLINLVAQERQAQPELYAHFSQGLRSLDSGASGPLLELWFKLGLLNLTGFRPELEHCVVCGVKDETRIYSFSPLRGGIACDADSGQGEAVMAPPAIKLWRLLSDYPYITVAKIAHGHTLAAATLASCDDFYDQHIGRPTLRY